MFDKAWPLALGRLESSTGAVVLTRLSQPRADAETKQREQWFCDGEPQSLSGFRPSTGRNPTACPWLALARSHPWLSVPKTVFSSSIRKKVDFVESCPGADVKQTVPAEPAQPRSSQALNPSIHLEVDHNIVSSSLVVHSLYSGPRSLLLVFRPSCPA